MRLKGGCGGRGVFGLGEIEEWWGGHGAVERLLLCCLFFSVYRESQKGKRVIDTLDVGDLLFYQNLL